MTVPGLMSAALGLFGSGGGGGGGGGGPPPTPDPTLEFKGYLLWSSGATITGSVDIGDADSTREVFVVVATVTGGSPTGDLVEGSSSVNGVVLTHAATEGNGLVAGATRQRHFCLYASVPTGSGSVSVTITMSGSQAKQGCIAAVFVVKNRVGQGNGESDAETTFQSGSNASLTAVTIPAGGFELYVGTRDSAGGSLTVSTSGTQQVSIDANSGSDVVPIIVCSRGPVSSEQTPTDTFTRSGGNRLMATGWSFV